MSYIWVKINLSQLRFISYFLLSLLTVVLHVLIMKMTDFCSNKRAESTESTERLKNPHAVLKPLTRKYLKKLNAAHKPLTEKYLVMVHFTYRHNSACQRLKWVFVRGHANLVGSRNFLGYITMQGTINFYSLFHRGVE